MEGFSSENQQKQAYFEALRAHDCISHIEEGMNIDASKYPLATVPEGMEVDVEILRDAAIGFLNAHTIVDTFSSHDERVAWYNESGVLAGGHVKTYMANRLRINILQSILRAARTYGNYFAKWHERGRFHAPTKLPEMTQSLTVEEYDQKSVEEKLALVERAVTVAKTALNEMIEFGWIEGEKVV